MDKPRIWGIFRYIEYDQYDDYKYVPNSVSTDFHKIRDFCINLNTLMIIKHGYVGLRFSRNKEKVLKIVPEKLIKKNNIIDFAIRFKAQDYPDLLNALLTFTEDDLMPLVEHPEYIVEELGWLE